MISTIVMDLDGTLPRSDKTISDYTVDVLHKCQAAGIKIVFATARSIQAAKEHIERIGPDYFIGFGGSLVLQPMTSLTIRRFDIPAEVADSLIKECLETPTITGIHASNEVIALSNNLLPNMQHYRITDFAHEQGNRYLKISVDASASADVERIAAHFSMCDLLKYTGEDLYRFAHRDAIKWKAVQAIAEYERSDTARFVAFGDDINDLEMIQHCGIGVAMQNAIPQVQAVAQNICASNDEDGVARLISEHVLRL